MHKRLDSTDGQVLARMRAGRPGRVFTVADFLDLGGRAAVYQALHRNARAGRIRKLARGLYDIPRTDPTTGPLVPSTDAIAAALSGRATLRLQPAGAHAANLLGLSTQVPVRAVFLTDGPSRNVQFGNRHLILKHTTPRQMATAGRISGTVIQALRWIGKDRVDDQVVSTLRRQLSARDKRQLLADQHHAPAWVADVLKRIAARPSRRS